MPKGLTAKTKEIIDACYEIAQERQPISVRGVCYCLFELYGLIPDMSKASTNKAGVALRKAREMGAIPWEWIVDGSRGGHTYNYGGWDSPADYAETLTAINRYRKDYWDAQPLHVEVWSEKETIAGVIEPVLQKWAVDFKNFRGFNSASNMHLEAERSANSDKLVVALYCGDFDPSGMFMSEVDLPARLGCYGGDVVIRRVALRREDTVGKLGHDVAEKAKDRRINWWHENGYGPRFWELDGMDPRDLRQRLDHEIAELVDMDAWERSQSTEAAERQAVDLYQQNLQNLRRNRLAPINMYRYVYLSEPSHHCSGARRCALSTAILLTMPCPP